MLCYIRCTVTSQLDDERRREAHNMAACSILRGRAKAREAPMQQTWVEKLTEKPNQTLKIHENFRLVEKSSKMSLRKKHVVAKNTVRWSLDLENRRKAESRETGSWRGGLKKIALQTKTYYYTPQHTTLLHLNTTVSLRLRIMCPCPQIRSAPTLCSTASA